VLAVRRESCDLMQQRENDIMEAHRKQLEDASQRHAEQVTVFSFSASSLSLAHHERCASQLKRARDESIRERGLLQAKVTILQEELGLADERYRNRPARKEDADLIATLTAQLEEAHNLIT
jgi:RNA polymerase-interacting CarD/CdnL/TRCF family regulator